MRAGSLVYPKLGGPLMTVESVCGVTVNVVWFDHGAGPFRRKYDVADIQVV